MTVSVHLYLSIPLPLYLQTLHADAGPFTLETELHVDNLSRLWDRFILAQQEKDMAIQAEIVR